MKCNGLHCPGCGHGGAAAGAVIALVVIIALALRKAWPAIVSAVEIAAWTVAGLTGTALVVTGGVLTVRVLRRARPAAAYRRGPVVIEGTRLYPPLPPTGRPALGAPDARPAGAWPLPGWWQEIRPQIGGDGDEHRR